MNLIKKILTSGNASRTLTTLLIVVIILLLSMYFNSRYNKGGAKANLIIARLLIIVECVLVVLWIFN